MTEEIKAGIKMLAEFEGWVPSPFPNLPDKMYKLSNDGAIEEAMYIDHCAYHTDYNELHRVWRKFRDLELHEDDFSVHNSIKNDIRSAITDRTIEGVFVRLVRGVEWYNSLKPKDS